MVARNEAETVKLRELERRSQANGVPGIQWLSGAGAARARAGRGRRGRAALPHHGHRRLPGHRPVLRRRRHRGRRPGADRHPRHRGCACDGDDRVEVDTPAGSHTLSRLVICAGLQADLLAAAVGDTAAPEIIPFRGEYLRLRPHAAGRVRRLIYPVPDPRYPFLGVHLTPRVDGTADLGPERGARAGPRGVPAHGTCHLDELGRLARSAAFWRLARQHWMTGVREMRGSLWRRAYLAEARTYLPWMHARRRDERARRGARPGGRRRRRRWSTTSASARSARSPRSATRRRPRPRPRWPSPSTSSPNSSSSSTQKGSYLRVHC